MGLRQSHYDGLPKTHFQHVLTAVAIDLVRIDAWLLAKLPGATCPASAGLACCSPAAAPATTAPSGGVLTAYSFDVIRQQSLASGGGGVVAEMGTLAVALGWGTSPAQRANLMPIGHPLADAQSRIP